MQRHCGKEKHGKHKKPQQGNSMTKWAANGSTENEQCQMRAAGSRDRSCRAMCAILKNVFSLF